MPPARDLPAPAEPGPSTPTTRRGARIAIGAFVLGMLLPWVVGLDVLGWGDVDGQTPWVRAIDVRTRAYAKEIRGPKVLFVGGSSVFFGVDAASLSARLDRPVVTYGLHAAIGVDVIAEAATDLIGAGDVVVYAPELPGFWSRSIFAPTLRGDWLVSHASSIRDPVATFPLRTWYACHERMRRFRTHLEARLAKGWGSRSRRAPAAAPPPPAGPQHPYEIAALDAHGQLAFPRPAPAASVQDQSPDDREATYDFEHSRGSEGARSLAQACRARGARLLVMPGIHVLHTGATPAYVERVRALEDRWMTAAQALGAERLLDAGEATLAQEFVYDTTNHLNDRGVDVLEERLAAALRRVLALPPK